MDIKIMTLNVNGISEKHKRTKIFDFMKNRRADIYLLQETHLNKTEEGDTWTRQWKGQTALNTGTSYSRGVGIFLHPLFHGEIKETKQDNEGRIICTKIQWENQEMNIMNVYAPNLIGERREFFNTLHAHKTGHRNFILGGDFNCVENPEKDRMGGNPNGGTAGSCELKSFTSINELEDRWRAQNPNERIFTWHTADYSRGSRLDRWYTPNNVHQDTSYIACPFSDHTAVVLQARLTEDNPRGKGIWKFNNNLLTDNNYCNTIRSIIRLSQKDSKDTLPEWWDQLKTTIRDFTVQYTTKKMAATKKEEKKLQSTLNDLQTAHDKNLDLISDTKKRLENIARERIEGIKIRSRVTWTEEGERPTKFFFQMEKTKQSKANITKLMTETREIEGNENILEEARIFYQKLYSKEDTDIDEQNRLLRNIERQLHHNLRENCEGPVTRDELTRAIGKMHRNKAPGSDGLTVEFYVYFWDIIANDLVKIFNSCYLREEMTTTQRLAILRLLFKKGEKTDIKNWRPISLLNTDYKILATAISRRLRPTLEEVIHEDQTCSIPNRTIYQNLQRLRDIAHLATTKNSNLILINLDQEKAFDRVNRDFLFKVLHKMNYGPSFMQWIKTLYKNANCRILNNGHLSDQVYLERGVRQGCPLSALLYTIVIEALLTSIRQDERINGFHIPGSSNKSKITAYADDATLTLTDDPSVIRCFDHIQKFERATNSKLNLDKTEGTYLGQLKGKDHGPVPIKWKEKVSVLGIEIGHNVEQKWDNQIRKVEHKLNNWGKRDLTITGKVLLIKTYALATITFLASVIKPPDSVLLKLHKLSFNFLWNSKNEPISRKTCHLPKEAGGLGIPNLHINCKALLIKWINRITNPMISSQDTFIARYWIGQQLGTIQHAWAWLRNNRTPHGHHDAIPQCYKEIISFAQKHRKWIEEENIQQISTKQIKQRLEEQHTPRVVEEWRRYIAYNPFPEVWLTIWRNNLSNNKEIELKWLLTHRVLKTKNYLRSWGMKIDRKCPFCNDAEDLAHAIYICKRARTMWNDLQPILNALANKTITINFDSIVFNRKLPEDETAKKLCMYILTLGTTTLWKMRNKTVWDGKQREQPVNKVKREMKFRITLESRKKKNNMDLWTYKGILCEYNNDNLTFKF